MIVNEKAVKKILEEVKPAKLVAATKYVDVHEIEKLEEAKYEAEINDTPFIKHNELQALQRRYEKQLVEADEYVKDWIATFNLIRRLIEIEQNRTENDFKNK